MCSAMEWLQCIYTGVYTGWVGDRFPVYVSLGWVVKRTSQGTRLLRGMVPVWPPLLAYFIEICISYYSVLPLCMSRPLDGCKQHLPKRRTVEATLMTCL